LHKRNRKFPPSAKPAVIDAPTETNVEKSASPFSWMVIGVSSKG